MPLTLTAYFVQAAVAAIRAVPEANSRWTDEALEIYDAIHIGVATAVEGTGLVVPVLRDAGTRDLFETARGLDELVGRARAGALAPADVRGGTFTISNHGVSGSLLAAPIIINQPQSAILGRRQAREARRWSSRAGGEQRIVVRPRCYVTLTLDHRVMDGHQANRFLRDLRRRACRRVGLSSAGALRVREGMRLSELEPDRARERGRAAGAAARAPAVVAAARLRERGAVPPQVRARRRPPGRPEDSSPTSLTSRSRIKDDLRAHYPFGMFAVPRVQIVRLHASSGTTGKPTVVGYTRGDIETWAGLVARSLRAAGGRPGDIVHIAYGYGLFTGGLGAHYGAERLGCTVVPMSGGQTQKQVQLICDLQARRHHGDSVLHAGDRRGVSRARAWIRRGARCASGSSAPSPGPRRCAARSRRAPGSTRSTSTACRR